MSTLDITVILLYLLALLGLGLWVSFTNKQKKSSDLFLAGRSLNWPTIGLSIFGTNISPLNIISACGLSYTYGMIACNFQWFAWLYLILLSIVFLPYYLKHDIQTMPQFMLRRYNESCRKALSWIVFLQISIGAGSVVYAGSMLVSQLVDLPVWQCVIMLTLFSVSFTITGGLKAVALTDSFQSIVMIGVCSVIGVLAMLQIKDWSIFETALDANYWKLLRPSTDPDYPWQAIIVGYPIMSIWYWCANQNIVQTTLGSKSLNEGRKGILFLSYLKLLVPLLFILPGIIARVVMPDLGKPDDAFLMMIYKYLPHGLIGLAIAVLIAALVGTVTAMFNSGSAVFTLDILPNFRKSASTPSVATSRWVIAGLASLSMIIAVGLDRVEGFNLFEKINAIFSFLCPSLVAVFIWGVFWKRISSKAAFYTLIVGNIPCVIISILYLSQYPSKGFYPNFFLISFYLFVAMSILLIALSYLFPDTDGADRPVFSRNEYKANALSPSLRWGWSVLAVIMISLYVYFN
jgi:SSS family solute:Na+ symporter